MLLVPSPPPTTGGHVFPTDFPPPREFVPAVKRYGGGRERGSPFNLGVL